MIYGNKLFLTAGCIILLIIATVVLCTIDCDRDKSGIAEMDTMSRQAKLMTQTVDEQCDSTIKTVKRFKKAIIKINRDTRKKNPEKRRTHR